MAELKLKNKTYHTQLPAFVMGIVNVTPDSFFQGSRGGYDRAFSLIEQGADILDIGGESTRPGFTPISEEEELNRVIPVIEEIRKKSQVIISVDTRKSAVAKQALKAGADIINDVAAFECDENMIPLLAETQAPVILMHGWGLSEDNVYGQEKIVAQVNDFFESKCHKLIEAGVSKENIILDPGIGFGKSSEENMALIKNTDLLGKGQFPVLMALSRKRVIGEITGRPIEERLTGTICADLISVIKGARIVRVHDVKETVDSLKVMKYLF